MYKIDSAKFDQTLLQFMERVLAEQDTDHYQHSTTLRFDSGWLGENEYYKYSIWERAQNVLQVKDWSETLLGKGIFTQRIIACIELPIEEGRKEKQNLLNQQFDVKALKDKLLRDVDLSDFVLYSIFCGTDDAQAFEDAIEVWGSTFPFLSFVFFLKDKDRYLPVRPNIMPTHLNRLGIITDCLSHGCTWEHYQEYLCILKDVQSRLQKQFLPDTTLLDAHSFVWSMWLLDYISQPKRPISGLPQQFCTIENESQSLQGSTRDAVIKARVNQSVFRARLLDRYPKCCLCGVCNPILLTASHIKPWANSSPAEKLDVDNGFLFCPNHDRLFDQGLISFEDSGKILIAEELSAYDRLFTNVAEGMTIRLTDGNRPYLAYHREHIFKS